MHFIIPHHIIHVVIYASTISYSMIIHIGSSEGITQAIALEGEEQTLEDLRECLDHRPTSFFKGKPRSILSLPCFTKYHLSPFMFDALGEKS